MSFILGESRLTSSQLVALGKHPYPDAAIGSIGRQRLQHFRAAVEAVVNSKQTVYGINTGFGFLSDVKIEQEKLQALQINLIRSHACGVGQYVPDHVVRALLVLRAHTFLLGHSGFSSESMEVIETFLKHDILPLIPEKGSVGASGDLAPLAHLALGLMGEGRVRYRGEVLVCSELLRSLGLKPLMPRPKEGLSLINGTHFMTTIAAHAVDQAWQLVRSADVIAAMSLDAIRGTTVAFDERIQAVRPHPGQKTVAANIRRLFESRDDQIMDSHAECGKVQDPYSFRCTPQVHGATRDALTYVSTVTDIELNSVTDNPLIFEGGGILSGGNFHGQPMAIAADFLAIALAEIGSISERRIEKITNPHLSGLPPFATRDSGINSGLMIPHVVSAALVSENKILCHPASVDSIPTSADKEDHVSMGPIAARKALQVAENVASVLAIELISAVQGISLLAPLKPGKPLDLICEAVHELSPALDEDRSLHEDIGKVSQWLSEGKLLDLLRNQKIEIH